MKEKNLKEKEGKSKNKDMIENNSAELQAGLRNRKF
jgi:hypothetical protein